MSDHYRTIGLKDEERDDYYQTSLHEQNGIAKKSKLNGAAIPQQVQGAYGFLSVVHRKERSRLSLLGGYLDSLG
jgi:hypothetical protein